MGKHFLLKTKIMRLLGVGTVIVNAMSDRIGCSSIDLKTMCLCWH